MVDVDKVRTFSSGAYLLKLIPMAIGMLALAAVIFALADFESSRDRKGIFAAVIVAAAGAGLIGYILWRRIYPAPPLLELSRSGIVYRQLPKKPIRLSWDDIEGIDTISISGARVLFRKITVVLIPKRLYDAKIDVGSWFWRGPYWNFHFIPKGNQVQIALHHEVLGVPSEELRAEIETRWRAFSRHPNAQLPAVPYEPALSDRVLDALTPTRTFKRATLIALLLAAIPVGYYWNWIAARTSFPEIPDGSASAYVRDLLDKGQIHARNANGQIIALTRLSVQETGPAKCFREVKPAPEQSLFLPEYIAHGWCRVDLKDQSGTWSAGIFKLVSKTFQSETWDGKPAEYRAIVPATLTVAEAEAKLCELGSCASAKPAR